MVVEVEVTGLEDPSDPDPQSNSVTIVPINGMEFPFPEEEGNGEGQVNADSMDERFTSVRQAIATHKKLNTAAQQARRLFWGHENRLTIEPFIHEFDDKGGFLEHTQRQRWTLGGWYSVCKHFLFDIHLQQCNMNKFYTAGKQILGRK